MKNKGAFSILLLYLLIIFLLSFIKDAIIYIRAPLLYLFSSANNIDLIAKIIDYVIYFIFYGSFGCVLCIFMYSNVGTYKEMIEYFIVIPLAIIVLSIVINCFFSSIDYLKYLFKYIFSIVGEFLSFIILEKRQKKQNKDD